MDVSPPEPKARAPFAQYLFDRGLKPRPVAKAIGGVSHEQIRRICLPYDDPQWRAPSGKLRQKISAYTGGVIGLQDWKPRVTKTMRRMAEVGAAAS